MELSEEDMDRLIESISDKIADKVENYLNNIQLSYVMELFLERVDIEEIIRSLIKK